MAKFTGNNQTLTINGGTAGTNFCITAVDYALDIDTYKVACAGGTHKATVAGQNDSTATLNVLIDEDAIENVFGSGGDLLRGANYADYDHKPEGVGAGGATITSTSATNGAASLSVPVEGLVSATVTVHFDDLTIAAQT